MPLLPHNGKSWFAILAPWFAKSVLEAFRKTIKSPLVNAGFFDSRAVG